MLGSHVHSHWLVRNLKIHVDGYVSIAHISRMAQVHRFHSLALAKIGTQGLSSNIASQEAMPLRSIISVSGGYALQAILGRHSRVCRRQERLDALNEVWGAEDPAAFVRDALIASGMTETEVPHVLSVTDANVPSTRYAAANAYYAMLLIGPSAQGGCCA